MEKRVKGTPPCVCVLAAGLRPASRPVALVVCGLPPCCSFLLLQESSKQRVIERIPTATDAYQECFFCRWEGWPW